MRKQRIILASASKARRKLMEELGIPFEWHASNYPEQMSIHKEPSRLAQSLASEKANYIAENFPHCIIIGADTFITLGYEKIGKPATVEDAKRIIRLISGNKIDVHTGVATLLTDQDGQVDRELVAHVKTSLTIKKLTEPEIRSLAEHEEALQISGAFSIEGEGGKFVETIDGDYNNVIGLPIFQLKEMLAELGVKVPN
jgi:septum formation protein